jgi:hypothetical protein
MTSRNSPSDWIVILVGWLIFLMNGMNVEQGIDSISLNPDSVVKTLLDVAATEQRLKPVAKAG